MSAARNPWPSMAELESFRAERASNGGWVVTGEVAPSGARVVIAALTDDEGLTQWLSEQLGFGARPERIKHLGKPYDSRGFVVVPTALGWEVHVGVQVAGVHQDAEPVGATFQRANLHGVRDFLIENVLPAPQGGHVAALSAKDVVIAQDQYAALAAALKPFIAVHDHPQVSGGEVGDLFVLDVGADDGAGLTVDDFRNLITAAGDVGLVNRPAPVERFDADEEFPF